MHEFSVLISINRNFEISNKATFVLLQELAGCTVFITGASCGIGKAIALKAAKDGAT